jgi:predicted glycoside hydrolase/deacetylase ChbG (UPF0249 family)
VTPSAPFHRLAAHVGAAPDARLVIAHQDDVGMCHSANAAFAELAGRGFITCGSVMVPCPWFREAVAIAKANPDTDIGVHLTLTSEWEHYRWRPISTASRASGLIDEDGYMWRRVPMLRDHVVAEAAEAEMRAQIDLALAAGLIVTHLDTHMGAALTPELIDIYIRLGRDYHLPILFPRGSSGYLEVLNMGAVDPALYGGRIAEIEAAGNPVIDHVDLTRDASPDDAEAAYHDMIAAVPPGLSFLALHCCTPGDIEAIVPPRAHWRTNEYRLFRDPAFLSWVAGSGIHLIGFREIQAAMNPASNP